MIDFKYFQKKNEGYFSDQTVKHQRTKNYTYISNAKANLVSGELA
jgi:hypothetical protein